MNSAGLILVLTCFYGVSGFMVGVDFNTYSATELN